MVSVRTVLTDIGKTVESSQAFSGGLVNETRKKDDDDDFCYKRVQTPGMSPPRASAWTYCLFTP